MFQIEETASMKIKHEKKLDVQEIMRNYGVCVWSVPCRRVVRENFGELCWKFGLRPLNRRNPIKVHYAECTIRLVF